MFISDTSTFPNRKLFFWQRIKGIGNFYDGTGTTLKNAGVVVCVYSQSSIFIKWHTAQKSIKNLSKVSCFENP